MSRRTVIVLGLAFALAGCGTGPSGAARPSGPADTQATAPAPKATPDATPALHVFRAQGGTVSGEDLYRSLRQWASRYDKVALARVVAIQAPQWNTRDGKLPSGLDFLDPVPGNGNALRILRPIRLELVRALRGDWAKGDFYTLRWGGRVGNDVEETNPDPFPLTAGQLMVVFARNEPIDIGAAFPLTVISDFPVDSAGRVLTPLADRSAPANPDETLPPPDPEAGITLDNIAGYVDLGPPPPGPG